MAGSVNAENAGVRISVIESSRRVHPMVTIQNMSVKPAAITFYLTIARGNVIVYVRENKSQSTEIKLEKSSKFRWWKWEGLLGLTH